jgi:hypothetical protein
MQFGELGDVHHVYTWSSRLPSVPSPPRRYRLQCHAEILWPEIQSKPESRKRDPQAVNVVNVPEFPHTNFINFRAGWTGHLFQRRFASVVLDDSHLRAAVCYVSLNPVRAGLVARAEDWPWSSVRAHLAGRDDTLAIVRPVLERMPDLGELLKNDCDEAFAVLRRAERTGRPADAEEFITGLERLLGRPTARHAPGRKPTPVVTEQQSNLL